MDARTLSELLETFPHTRFHQEVQLLTWHPKGLLDDALADDIVRFVESEAFVETPPQRCYTDFSGLTHIQLTLNHVFDIAQHRHEARAPLRSAFCASSVVGSALAEMYAHMMLAAPIHVRAFRERSAAADWLGVPLELLQPI